MEKQEGLQGHHRVSCGRQPRRNPPREEGGGNRSVGDEEEDLVHVPVLHGHVAVAGALRHGDLYPDEELLPAAMAGFGRAQSCPKLALHLHEHVLLESRRWREVAWDLYMHEQWREGSLRTLHICRGKGEEVGQGRDCMSAI